MEELKAKMKTYIHQLESGEIKSKQIKLLAYIKENPTLDFDNPLTDILTMKRRLGMAHQSLTASLSNIEDLGLVKVIGQFEVESPTKSKSTYSIYQFVSSPLEREKLIKRRLEDKYSLWVSAGIRNFKHLLPTEVLFHLTYESK